jgi:hypothetical protein
MLPKVKKTGSNPRGTVSGQILKVVQPTAEDVQNARDARIWEARRGAGVASSGPSPVPKPFLARFRLPASACACGTCRVGFYPIDGRLCPSDGMVGMSDGDRTTFQEDQSLSKGSACDLVARSATDRCDGQDFLGKSLLHQELRAEYEEIMKHKWIESEKAGRDIGLDSALMGWVIKHRSKWRRARQCRLR